MNNKEKFYNSIAENFDEIMNMYDTNRRIEVIFDDFLGNKDLKNKTLLDGGCGTGWFTKKALERGAIVTSVDISEKLVKLTKNKNLQTFAATASLLDLPFDNNTFDVVISSDVIEHTDDPFKATDELIRVLKPYGLLCLTVPNKSFWYFSLILANFFRIRKYKGNENWLYYNEFRKYLMLKNLHILEYKGINLYPFVINKFNSILKKLDKILDKKLGKIMVNIAVFGEKK